MVLLSRNADYWRHLQSNSNARTLLCHLKLAQYQNVADDKFRDQYCLAIITEQYNYNCVYCVEFVRLFIPKRSHKSLVVSTDEEVDLSQVLNDFLTLLEKD